jgi:N-methylhydantoinase B
MQPASLPAGATELLQEGLVIPPLRLTDEVLAMIAANTRRPDERVADLRAQVACHTLGERRLAEIAETIGRRRLLGGMDELYAYGVRRMRAAIRRLPDGKSHARDVMEGDGVTTDDIPIAVEVTVAGERLVVDFAGTAPQQPGNVNCPLAVTRAAVAYAVRVVCDPDLPASGGALEPVEIRAEPGSLVNAYAPAAVVAGNVETSSRIVDVVLAALTRHEPVGQGQGTMNNVSFGNDSFVYFETLAGGQGGSVHGDGPDAVHVAMTNTLNTPVEVLEQEYPLRVERYGLRHNSGGEGRHRGGNGVVRAYRALEPCSASLVTERRVHPPAGAAGGAPGAAGENRLNGRRVGSKVSLELAAGDVIEVRTPGGGGWGKPRS